MLIVFVPLYVQEQLRQLLSLRLLLLSLLLAPECLRFGLQLMRSLLEQTLLLPLLQPLQLL